MEIHNMFNDIQKILLEYEKPSIYLNNLLDEGKLSQYPFTMLSDLTGVDQNLKYHPEGSVWNHTLLVVDEAAKRKNESKDPVAFMWAALLHDIGKKPTTKVRKGKITSYNHETIGKKMAEDFLIQFNSDKTFVDKVTGLIRWHMEPLFIAKGLPFSNIKGMLKDVPLNEIIQLSLCDRFGRGYMSDEKKRDEEKGIEMFKEKCKKIME